MDRNVNLLEKGRDELGKRITNTSTFEIVSSSCKVLISKNLKYAVYWNDSSIAILDLDRKDVVSKYLNELNPVPSKIVKLKLTETNNIVYLKQINSNKSSIAISHLDFLGEHYEYCFNEDIVDYIYAESKILQSEYLFFLTSKGELFFCQNFDINRMTKIDLVKKFKLNSSLIKQINDMIYIENTDNLILFFNNGLLLNFYVTLNHDLIDEKILVFDEAYNIEAPLESNNNTEENMKLGSSNTCNFLRFHNIRLVEQLHEEDESNMNIDEEVSSEVGGSHYIIILYTHHKNDTKIVIYSIQSNKICLFNRTTIRSRLHLDSYVFDSTEASYLVMALRDNDKVEIHASAILSLVEGKNENPVTKISEYEEIRKNFVALHISGCLLKYNNKLESSNNSENDNKSLDFYQNEFGNFSISCFLRRILCYNESIYVNDYCCDKSSGQKKNLGRYGDEAIEINDEIYFENCVYSDILDKNELKRFFLSINRNLYNFTKVEVYKSVESKEIDLFLISLILNNKVFMLRNYILLKSNNIFIISNEKIRKTVEPFFFIIEKSLKDSITTTELTDSEILVSEKYKSILEILKIVYIVIKNRLISPSKDPFKTEMEIISEELAEIEKMLFRIEKLLLAVKIIRSFKVNVKENQENSAYFIYISQYFEMRKKAIKNICIEAFKEEGISNKNNLTIFEVLLGTVEDNGNIKFMIKNLVFEENFTKYQEFFYFYYIVFELLLIKFTDGYKTILKLKNDNILSDLQSSSDLNKNIYSVIQDRTFRKELKEFFNEMTEEFDNFGLISENLFLLDLNIMLKEKSASLIYIDIIQITKFFYLISNFQLIKDDSLSVQNSPENHSIFYKIICFMQSMSYKVESLLLSKLLISISQNINDLKTQLIILLESNLLQHAVFFLDSCFINFCYSPDLFRDENQIIKKIKTIPEYKEFKELFFTFYRYLIKNDKLEFLLSLPLNEIEVEILREFINKNKEFEEILLIYYLYKNEYLLAKQFFEYRINQSKTIPKETKDRYAKQIDSLEFIDNNVLPKSATVTNSSELFVNKKLAYNFQSGDQSLNNSVIYNQFGELSQENNKMLIDYEKDVGLSINQNCIENTNEKVRAVFDKRYQTAAKSFGISNKKLVRSKVPLTELKSKAENKKNFNYNFKNKEPSPATNSAFFGVSPLKPNENKFEDTKKSSFSNIFNSDKK